MLNRWWIAAGATAMALVACSYTPAPEQAVGGSEVGGTGNVAFSHRELGGQRHLVQVTAAPGVMETESSIAQRLYLFANNFAAETCPAGFDFVDDPNLDQRIARGFMKRTKTFVFKCA